ncbi:MAG: MIP/aquaporin family protein [Pseudolysinimonas sp.]|uniref:MIP/aquaporin family protein n=1 Tax=Pseudolysinimonas sp. TaxID=2680009 RepID=UPI0032639046
MAVLPIPDVLPLPRRLLAEFLGTLLLVAIVVGSGIAAQTLSPGDAGLQLLETALATAFGLFVLIAVFAPLSGAHLNPAITAVAAAFGSSKLRDVLPYLLAQVSGGIIGAILANLMFGLAPVAISTHDRWSWPHALAEVVATAGLVLVVFLLENFGREALIAPAVAAYIGAGYFFTSSTAFANPAVTVGRMFSDTFAGIAPGSALGFVAAQVMGGVIGVVLLRLLLPKHPTLPAT